MPVPPRSKSRSKPRAKSENHEVIPGPRSISKPRAKRAVAPVTDIIDDVVPQVIPHVGGPEGGPMQTKPKAAMKKPPRNKALAVPQVDPIVEIQELAKQSPAEQALAKKTPLARNKALKTRGRKKGIVGTGAVLEFNDIKDCPCFQKPPMPDPKLLYHPIDMKGEMLFKMLTKILTALSAGWGSSLFRATTRVVEKADVVETADDEIIKMRKRRAILRHIFQQSEIARKKGDHIYTYI